MSVVSNSRPTRSIETPYWYGLSSLEFAKKRLSKFIDRHIHRADLHRDLLECATVLGVKVHLESPVIDVDPHTFRPPMTGAEITAQTC